MPAPNWPQLYEFEDVFEAAVKTVLDGAGIASFIQRSESVITTPCVSIQFSLGAATEHYGIRTTDGENFLDRWNGKLVFTVFTDRTKNNAAHSGIRSVIRWKMQKLALFTAQMPYHRLTRAIETGTGPQIHEDNDRDRSDISFDIILDIRADAWPTASF